MKLVFATHNQNKLEEVQKLIPSSIQLYSLDDIGCTDEIAETGDTLLSNAWIKADFIYNQYKMDCFADDTGLEVTALGGAPGVFSARYAGSPSNAVRNVQKLLHNLKGQPHRGGQFRTVIALHLKGKQHTFEGIVKGKILDQPTGSGGFGYDPIFQPHGFDNSFAQMPMDTKNKISHRGIAIQKLVDFLKTQAAMF